LADPIASSTKNFTVEVTAASDTESGVVTVTDFVSVDVGTPVGFAIGAVVMEEKDNELRVGVLSMLLD